jgi:hypothetical protein
MEEVDEKKQGHIAGPVRVLLLFLF